MSLRESVLALMPAEVRWFEGQVPSSAPFPRVSVTVRVPGVDDRALTRSPHARQVRVDFIAAGATDASLHFVAGRVLDAYEGARPVAAGWVCGPFELVGDPSTYSDRDVTISGLGVHPRVTAFTLTATASPIPVIA